MAAPILENRRHQLESLLSLYQQQIYGLENTIATSPSEDKVRLQQKLKQLQAEAQTYEEELARLALSGGDAASPPDRDVETPEPGTTAIVLESPEGQVSIQSRFYIASPLDDRCHEEGQV